MKSVINFIKGIKVISWILVVLAIIVCSIISPNESSSFGTFIIVFRYLLIAIITEICSNPVIKNSSLKICQFLSSTKVISRILVYCFIIMILSCVMTGEGFSSSLIAVFYCLIPTVLIEWRKNGFLRSLRQNKTVKQAESDSVTENIQNNVGVWFLYCCLGGIKLTCIHKIWRVTIKK